VPDWRLLALGLLASASTVQARDVAVSDALPRAIRTGDAGEVKTALAHGDPNTQLAFGATPLAQAIFAQSPEMVAALLARGAKLNVADGEGVTPLALACELGSAPIVTQLLDAHADVRAGASDGTSALAVCARFGPAAAVGRMLAGGATVDKPDAHGLTPLMWAASSGHVEAIRLLLKAGANANGVTPAGFTPLFFSIKSGVPEATEVLLAAGADTSHRGPENTSAAQLAAYQHNDAAVGMLLTRGAADLAERDREGMQLLHRAAAAGDNALVGQLLAKGADPNALSGPSRIKWVTEANFGQPPAPVPPLPALLIAAENGHAAVMQQLVAAGANPRFVAEDGTNVVLAAARGKSAAALELALTMAPDADVANANGMTALHILAGGGPSNVGGAELVPMLKVLAAHGARTDIKTKKGFTATTIALGGLTEVKVAFTQVFPDAAKTALGPTPTITHGEAPGRRDTVN
jgi:ankyrin repeat protein